MLKDRYGYGLSTASPAARDAYVRGLDIYLAADVGAEASLREAIEADQGFALAHAALARCHHVNGRGRAARAALADARAMLKGVSAREASQVDMLGSLIEGDSVAATRKARSHLEDHPRDAVVAQTCLGVFSLIGFSGMKGREEACHSLAASLAPAFGEDWWFLSALAFAQMETGRTTEATRSLETAIALNPRNANAAHHRAHLYYELGETRAGLAYLEDWQRAYDPTALLYCHLSWHRALWAMGEGDTTRMWQIVDADIAPPQDHAPAINVLTDLAALLFRAELAGHEVAPERWQTASDFARAKFATPGVAFADVHAALAHAMAGEGEALSRLIAEARGPAADLVAGLGRAFGHLAAQDWAEAAAGLSEALEDHERIGGSRAQRDLIEHGLVAATLRLGKPEDARRLLARRPKTATQGVVKGLA